MEPAVAEILERRRLLPMGDMVVLVLSNDPVSPGPARLGNKGILLKLLLGEVETDPDESGDCGVINPMLSKGRVRGISSAVGEIDFDLGGASSNANRLDGRSAFAVGLIGMPPILSLSPSRKGSSIVPGSLFGTSGGAVTIPLAMLKNGLEGMLLENVGLI
jgi:hypothetical protein